MNMKSTICWETLVKQSDKPIITVVDGGAIYDPLAEALEKGDIPVFRTADRAMTAIAKYIEGPIRADLLQEKKINELVSVSLYIPAIL